MHKISILLLLLALSASALTLPKSIYKNSTITPESDYTIYKQMQKAKKLFQKGKFKEAAPLFIRILLKASKSKKEQNIDQYDYLYAHYALLQILEREQKKEKEYIKLSQKILHFLDVETKRGIWEEGELGQLQMQVYKRVGNKLALLLYQDSQRKNKKKMKEALKVINKSEKYIRSDSDFYIKETKEIITNALKGNPPLKSEKKIKVVKLIKKAKSSKKLPQK